MNIEFFQKPPSHLSTDSAVSIFFYEFQHRPSSFAKIRPAWVRADHGAEKTFIFGGPFLMDESSMLEATGEEQELSLTMMAQWTHFSWTGCLAYQGASSGYQIWDPPRKQVHVGKTPINAFLGVPFYRPPVGACKFTAPEPPEPWEGIRDATTYAPV
ncbi:fatty acyl-CoA hydrolase precursor, medium chain [Globicephala melas]|uniref:fatty acyl-CoA hydrolase precursor, medium chain n=1 Tax=Globicephala melas TaxID=9731 RepID=UPI00293D3191|nr:fatty acyl-CoA hydrolase precursor, medium chain [Globicephala melas]